MSELKVDEDVEDVNVFLWRLEQLNPGINFSKAKRILQDWDRDINQIIQT